MRSWRRGSKCTNVRYTEDGIRYTVSNTHYLPQGAVAVYADSIRFDFGTSFRTILEI